MLIRSRPMKRNENPMKNSPIDLLRLLLLNRRGMERPMTGRTKAEMLTLKPKRAMTQAVNVVPTFAPMITAIDWPSDMRPAFTKLTTITVEAEELWMSAVMSMPVRSPVKRFRVMAERMFLRRSPAAFCRPSLITFMP